MWPVGAKVAVVLLFTCGRGWSTTAAFGDDCVWPVGAKVAVVLLFRSSLCVGEDGVQLQLSGTTVCSKVVQRLQLYRHFIMLLQRTSWNHHALRLSVTISNILDLIAVGTMEVCMSTTSLPPPAESSTSSDIERHIEELRREAAAHELANDACLFVHYSDVLLERASSLLRCDASATIVLKKFNVDFKHLHLVCLRPRRWLNDEVVNLFMQLSQERDSAITRSTLYPRNPNLFMNSFFYLKLAQEEGGFNYSNVKRWTKNVDIFTCNQIFFPINFKKEHWALVCVSMLRKKILYLDSVSRSGKTITENILKWLQEESLSRTKKPLSSFSVEDVCCPQQSTSYDCGIFILAFVDLLANDLPVGIMQQSLCDNLRLSLCIWIVRGRLVLVIFYHYCIVI